MVGAMCRITTGSLPTVGDTISTTMNEKVYYITIKTRRVLGEAQIQQWTATDRCESYYLIKK